MVREMVEKRKARRKRITSEVMIKRKYDFN
jgi:hypothetical protein